MAFVPEQRLSLVTMAAADLEASTAFYRRLGWEPAFHNEEVAFFQLAGIVLGLWHRPRMAKELRIDEAKLGPGGMEVAHNVRRPEDVDAFLALAREAGARVVSAAKDTPWGGRSGHFADLDGHRWEVAWNPAWTIGEDGRTMIG